MVTTAIALTLDDISMEFPEVQSVRLGSPARRAAVSFGPPTVSVRQDGATPVNKAPTTGLNIFDCGFPTPDAGGRCSQCGQPGSRPRTPDFEF